MSEAMMRELADRVVQLEAQLQQTQQSAQYATQMAAAAAASSPPSSPMAGGARAQRPMVDTRVLGKPGEFHGESDKWADWSFVLKGYCGALSGDLQQEMKEAAESESSIPMASMSEYGKSLSRQLYHILVMLCRGAALERIKNTEENNGLEVWRKFCAEWEPRTAGRFRGMLSGILAPDLSGDLGEAMEVWERAIREYEHQSGEKVSDNIKVGIVLQRIKDERIKMHLQLNASRLTTYAELRVELREIQFAMRQWNTTGGAMEVDAVFKGKNKGKGKSGKDKGHKGVSKDSSKSKGKGSKDGSGKSSEKGAQGRGKGAFQGYCNQCGKWGHRKADCYSKKGHEKTQQQEVQGSVSLVENYQGWDEGHEDGKWVFAVVAEANEGKGMLLVDSGAAVHVCPRWYVGSRSIEKSERLDLRSANGEPIVSYGAVEVPVQCSRDVVARIKFNVADVAKPILSVSKLIEKGYNVCFAGDKSYIERNGKKLYLKAGNGVFYIETHVLEHEGWGKSYESTAVSAVHVSPVEHAGGTSSSSEEPPATAAQGPPAAESREELEQQEGHRARSPTAPTAPSEQERQEHMLTHVPFRSWCPHCVRGKAVESPHRRVQAEADEMARVEMDYMYLASDTDESGVTVLGLVDCKSGAMAYYVVVGKGPVEYAIQAAVHAVEEWGHRNFILQTDQDHSVTKLAAEVKKRLDGEIRLRHAPKYSHGSNGHVERAHQSVQGQVRTMKIRLEEVYGIKLTPQHVLVPWLVRHAAWVLTHYLIKDDGRTAFGRLRGKEYKADIVEFGEQVWFKDPAKAHAKFDERWASGVWVGRVDRSDEHILLTANGAQRVRSIRRKEEMERWGLEELNTVRGSPWDPKGDGRDQEQGIASSRKRYITQAAVAKYGPTKGCLACMGESGTHPPRCRARFDDLFAAESRAMEGSAMGSAAASSAEPASAGTASAAPASVTPGASASAGSVQEPDGKRFRITGKRAPEAAAAGAADDVAMEEPGGSEVPMSKRMRTVGIYAVCEEEPIIAYDARTWEVLDPDKVRLGRAKELAMMKEFDVYEEVNMSEISGKVIKCKWVETNKGADVRSRLVATEVAYEGREDTFAGTPPLMIVKAVLSLAASKGRNRLVGLHDVSVAFFHAEADENLFVKPPADLATPGKVWRLKKAMYGTRRASLLWQQKVKEVMEKAGFVSIKVVPNLYYHKEWDVTTAVHGDDFISDGVPESLDKLDTVLKENFMVKVEPRVGPGGASAGKYLNRTLSWDSNGFKWEPDEKHARAIVEELGLMGAKAAPTPGTSATGATMTDALDELTKEEAALFRSVAGRAQYLAMDRKDIQYSVKEIMQHMSNPNKLGMARLKRLGRYLIDAGSYQQLYKYQDMPSEVTVLADSDWAGDKVSRKSTSSGDLFFGNHLLESYSSTQQVIALSSGEAEFYAIGKAAALGLMMKHIYEELGLKIGLVVLSDSSAGRAMCQRTGCGRVRHIETRFLWIQEQQLKQKLAIKAVRTENNTADVGTKHLGADLMKKLMGLAGVCVSAPKGWPVSALVAAVFVTGATGAEVETVKRVDEIMTTVESIKEYHKVSMGTEFWLGVTTALVALFIMYYVVKKANGFYEQHFGKRYKHIGDFKEHSGSERGSGRALAGPEPWVGAQVVRPRCPLCGGPMVFRKASLTGHRFLGCLAFPRCRGTRNLDSGLFSGTLEWPEQAAGLQSQGSRSGARAAARQARGGVWSD